MKYYLYGAGNNCRSLLKLLKYTRIEAIIDKDTNRCGKMVNGIPTISFDSFLENKCDSYIFVTTVYYTEEIRNLFIKNGLMQYGFCPWLENCYNSIEQIIDIFELKKKTTITFLSNNPISNEIICCLNDNTQVINFIEDNSIEDNSIEDDTVIYVTERQFANSQKYNNLIDIIQMRSLPSRNKLLKFKDFHKNQSCFIIGNGPSLLYKDLEMLNKHQAICFGVNRVYLGYKNTNWRPDYYVVADYVIINTDFEKIMDLEGIKFIRSQKEIENAYCFNNIPFEYNDNNFSLNIEEGIYNGFTVIYECIQIAVYMGFKTIYLLGVDMSKERKDAAEEGQHFYSSPNVFENLGKGNREGAIAALEVAKKNADCLGVKIYNATRGGELEVFERVDIDSLFED